MDRPQAKKKPARLKPGGLFKTIANEGSAQRDNALGKTAELARSGILVKHAAGNTTRQFRLHGRKRRTGGCLVSSLKRRFDLLHQSADTANAAAVNLCAPGVTTNALLCLRRVCHACPQTEKIVEEQRAGDAPGS
jgi:hypothetical protein